VRAVIRGRVPPGEVDDLVQETLARAVVHVDRLDPSRLGAWLTTVAINATCDWHRQRQRDPTASDPESFHHIPTGAAVDATVATRDEVRRALDALPATQRDLLVRHHVHGFTRREIADQIGLTIEAVNSLCARAKRGFVAAIEQARTLVAIPITSATGRLRRLQSVWMSETGHEMASQFVMALVIVGVSVATAPTSTGASSVASADSAALAVSARTGEAASRLEVSEQAKRDAVDNSGLGLSTVDGQPAVGVPPSQRDLVTVEDPIDNPVDPDGNRGRTRVWIEGDPNDSIVLSHTLPLVDAACDNTSPQTCDDTAS
jgi:RNA polymerase sigma-70 factor (ECF subfamily)